MKGKMVMRKEERKIRVADFFSAITIIAIIVFVLIGVVYCITHNKETTEVKTLQQEDFSLIEKSNFRKTEFNAYYFLTVDNDTKIIYIINNQCSGNPFACPYLGEHGRPCRLNSYNQIEELSAKEVYGTE